MIAHTEAYSTAVTTPVKTVRAKFYLHNNSTGTNSPIFETNENSISLSSIGSYIGSGAKKITAKIVGNQTDYLSDLIKIDLQVKTDSIDWQTVNLGVFTAYTVEYNMESDITTLELYDPMYMLSITPYTVDNDLFPLTVSQLAALIASSGGITLDPDFDDLPNSDVVIPIDLWDTIQNTSYRDVINEIAQTTGTTAISPDGVLLFRKFGVSGEGITEPNIKKVKLGQKWGNVNSISLSRQPQNDNILLRDEEDAATNGIFEVVITNNQIMDSDRATYIQPIYNELVTDTPFINYYNAEITTEGHGYYEVGDVIVVNLGGDDYPILITEVALTVDGGITETIKSVIPTDPSVNNTTSGGILKTLYNTEIQVDKQGNDITSIVSQQNIYQDFVNTNFTEIYQDIDDITLSVQNGGGVNQIKNSVGYSLDTDGNLNLWAVS
jgi:hypothetical protein